MHPRIEARRQSVEMAHRIRALKQERETLMRDLREIRDALQGIRGDYMNLPSVAALVASADDLLRTVEEIDVHGDEDHVRSCRTFFDSSLRFIESTRRTLDAARGVMAD